LITLQKFIFNIEIDVILKVDYLIIGFGISGCNLALTLAEKGLRVAVVDDKEFPSASRIAAGLFNPITGAKLLKTWHADVFFPFLSTYYRSWEEKLQTRFFYPIGIYVPFESTEVQNDWIGAEHDSRYADYVASTQSLPLSIRGFKNPYGGMLLRYAGYLQVNAFLEKAKMFLQTNHIFIEETLHFPDIVVEEKRVIWKNIVANKIIFADGQRNAQNPFFQKLRYHRVKGEILTVQIYDDVNLPHVINRGVWIVPQQKNTFKIGSTYDNHNINTIPTQVAQDDILKRFEHLFDIPYQVIEHYAAIRPATYDRKPFIGLHPQFPAVGIFNGMGAKSISMSPYLALHFYEYLHDNQTLMTQVDCNRNFK